MIAFELSVIELRKNIERSEKQFIRCVIRYVKLGMRECVKRNTQNPPPFFAHLVQEGLDGHRFAERNEERRKNLIIYCY